MEIDVLTCQHHVEHETGCPSCARDAVFDAAMAALRNGALELCVAQLYGIDDMAWDARCLRKLIAACRKAEEVERG